MTIAGNRAILDNDGAYTSFTYGDQVIRFRTPRNLQYYTRVKTWDDGYLVVDAQYDGLGETEEYIDLVPILEHLYLKPEAFLSPIKEVAIAHR